MSAGDRRDRTTASPRVERLTSTSAERTEAIGARIAERLGPGDVVLLVGELGTGKTTLVRGAVAALGSPARVTSPTFALAHRYDGGRVPLAHLDLYRLGGGDGGAAGVAEGPGDGLGIDDEELADEISPDVAAFVEWPGRLAATAADRLTLEVRLSHAGGDRRDVELRWSGPRS